MSVKTKMEVVEEKIVTDDYKINSGKTESQYLGHMLNNFERLVLEAIKEINERMKALEGG